MPIALIAEMKKPIFKFTWNCKEPPKVKTTFFFKKIKVGGLTFPDFKAYYKATVIKTVRHWHKDRHKSTKGME